MKSWLYVGAKVVCVDGCRDPDIIAAITFPDTGGIYTIREVVAIGQRFGVRLVELVNGSYPSPDGMGECAFNPDRFRPVTDISQFRQIVADVKAGNLVQYNDKVPA